MSDSGDKALDSRRELEAEKAFHNGHDDGPLAAGEGDGYAIRVREVERLGPGIDVDDLPYADAAAAAPNDGRCIVGSAFGDTRRCLNPYTPNVNDVRVCEPCLVEPSEPQPPTQCEGTLGSKPSWMSEGQYDPCCCRLIAGHDGAHWCEHLDHGAPSAVFVRGSSS